MQKRLKIKGKNRDPLMNRMSESGRRKVEISNLSPQEKGKKHKIKRKSQRQPHEVQAPRGRVYLSRFMRCSSAAICRPLGSRSKSRSSRASVFSSITP